VEGENECGVGAYRIYAWEAAWLVTVVVAETGRDAIVKDMGARPSGKTELGTFLLLAS
jgi:hypothetical protein